MIRWKSEQVVWVNELSWMKLKLNRYIFIFLLENLFLFPNICEYSCTWSGSAYFRVILRIDCWQRIPGHCYIPFLLICLNGSIQMPDLSPEICLMPKWAEMNGGMILGQFSCPWGLLYQILKLSNPFHLWPWPGYSEASGVDQINLTSWLERLGQLNFQEINLEKMIFLSKRMSQTLPSPWLKKKNVPSLLNQFYFHFNWIHQMFYCYFRDIHLMF